MDEKIQKDEEYISSPIRGLFFADPVAILFWGIVIWLLFLAGFGASLLGFWNGSVANGAIPPETTTIAPEPSAPLTALEECECEGGELIVQVDDQFYLVSIFLEEDDDIFIHIDLLEKNIDGLFMIVDEPIDAEEAERILLFVEELLWE